MIYGHNKTIHRTGHVDVETYKGRVVAVWFRCATLPFEQRECSKERAAEMDRMTATSKGLGEIQAIEFDPRPEQKTFLEEKTSCSSN